MSQAPAPILRRLLGQETELALRFTPSPGGAHPGNRRIYHAIQESVAARVYTRPGEQGEGSARAPLFLENGGALYYEYSPAAPEGGLLELATPECKSPREVLLHQRALEALLLSTLPEAERRLAERGFPGRVGLLKNARDAEGHVFGPQESYEAEVARGAALVLWRLALVGLLLLALSSAALLWLLTAALAPYYWALSRLRARLGPAPPSRGGRWWARAVLLFSWPAATLLSRLLAALAFRRVRSALGAFLISRPVLSGAGWVDGEGHYWLGEKAPAIGCLVRRSAGPGEHSIFDTANLAKRLSPLFSGRLAPFLALFAPRQRLQLGLADANPSQVAEYLKLGSTTLVLDMAEAGALWDAPRLADPIAALHALAADAGLTTRVRLTSGEERSALELQRWYLERARAFLAAHPAPALEAQRVVTLWQECLDLLGAAPERLFGQLDWVSKRVLLDRLGDAPPAARRKLALAYHELGRGYAARLERAGLAAVLVSGDEIQRAIREPPGDSPAHLRGQLIRDLASRSVGARVSWEAVRVGEERGGEIISLDERRRG